MGTRRSYTPEQRKDALRIYVEHGPAEAGRRTGIPGATIRSWAKRDPDATVAREQAATRAIEGARLTWAQRRATVAALAGEGAETFGRLAIDAANRGHSRKARDLAASFAIAVDKSLLLQGEATSRHETLSDEDARRELKRLRNQARQTRDELATRRQARNAAPE